ncbi:MAG: hypothetical protein BGN88_14025 [Clostridiales bacterium 43-6]|nr:MAG: hypothetical protein BGN88_14025 [Clostridiales bacterium 43-6]
MITIFNRKELFVTFSMAQQSQIRSLLAENQIDYRIRTINLMGSSIGRRADFGTLGANMDYAYEYIIYVHNNDYNKAFHIIHTGDIKK